MVAVFIFRLCAWNKNWYDALIAIIRRNNDDAIMPVTWLLTVGQPAVGPVSAVNGQSGIIGNQAEMMELEAAVIDGTRFLCYEGQPAPLQACLPGPESPE